MKWLTLKVYEEYFYNMNLCQFKKSVTTHPRVIQWERNNPTSSGASGNAGLIPQSGRSPGRGNGNQLQYSCL